MKKIAFLAVWVSLTACTKQPDLKGFDLARWRADRGGCKGQRLAQLDQLKALRRELKGVSANDFADLFGKPDVNQLADRNQEYYLYFLESGPHCQDTRQLTARRTVNARSVAVRFSAIGLATEITFQRGAP
ncbi:MAG: hypothetical protein LH606_22280 [Cytophagaceae bacterium]|nr:hypothetical protein [Cytophagaceae bacterium]